MLDPQALQDCVKRATAKGASACDLFAVEEESLEVDVRRGTVEKLQFSRSHPAGIRLFRGKRAATASTSDLSPKALSGMVDTAWDLSRFTVEDAAAGLPEESPPLPVPAPGSWDPAAKGFSAARAIELARRCEEAALAYDPRITNSDRGGFTCSLATVHYADSRGRSGTYTTTLFSLAAVPVAGQDGRLQRAYWHDAQTRFERLADPESIGREAARRVLRRLGARKGPTKRVPVIFEAPAAASLMGHLCQALSGDNLYRGTSFLAGALGERLFPEGFRIWDDPTRDDLPAAKPFDGDGIPTRRKAVAEDGTLCSYLLDVYSGRRLGMATTGNASRAPQGVPSAAPTNFWLEAGNSPPEEMVRSVKEGLLVTELMGMGVNPVTGDYSRGAAGLWIEDGEPAYPVQEVTVAGNLRAMCRGVAMRGNDLAFRSSVAAPTLLIDGMVVAGQ